MRAWIFLRAGAPSDWPVPYADAPGRWRLPDMGAPGVTVSSRDDLAYWIDDVLWEVETAGGRLAVGNAIFVARARLVRRVEAWRHATWARFVTACHDDATRAERESQRPDKTADLAARLRRVEPLRPALAGYLGALVAASSASEADVPGQRRAFSEARARQSSWIARALAL